MKRHRTFKVTHGVQDFNVKLNRFHGAAHSHIKRNSMGDVIMLKAPTCVNRHCELNMKGGEPHFAPKS